MVRMESSFLLMVGKRIWRRDIFTHKPMEIIIRDKDHARRLAKYSREMGFRYYAK